MESTEHHHGASATADTGHHFSFSRLQHAVSASRHHAPVTALHFSPGLTKHTRARLEKKKRKKKEEDRRDRERKRCLAFNLSHFAVKNEWALSLLAARRNRTVIVISQQAPELAHHFTPTNMLTPPSIYPCLPLTSLFLIQQILPSV